MKTGRIASIIALIAFAACLPLSFGQVDKPNLNTKKAREKFKESYNPLSAREPVVTEIENAILDKIRTMILENPEQAKTMLEDMVGSGNPISAAFNHALGNIYHEASQFVNAEVAYLAAIDKHKDFQRAWNGLGLTRFRLNDYKGALTALSKSIDLGANDATTYGIVGYLHLRDGNLKSAEMAYSLAILKDPENTEWTEGMAEIYLDMGRDKEAIRVLEQLVRAHPEDNKYWLLLANAYLSMDENLKTARCIEIARRVGKVDSDALLLLGNIYLKEGVYELAGEAIVAAVEQGGDFTIAKALESLRYVVDEEEYELAELLMDKIGDLDDSWNRSRKADYHSAVALLKLNEGNTNGAAIAFEQVIELEPFNGYVLLRLAQIYDDAGEKEKAMFLMERASSVPKFEYDALRMRIDMLLTQNKLRESLPLLERAIQISPNETLNTLYNQVKRAAVFSEDAAG